MEIQAVMENVISLFLIIFVGIYGVKKGIINEEVEKGLRNLLLKITLPLLVVSSFSLSFEDDMMQNVLKSFLYSFIAFIIAIIVSYIFLIFFKDKEKGRVLQFANVFSNCGFIGFPIIESIFGGEGVIYTSIFNMFFSIFLWSYGVILYSDKLEKKDIKNILLNPGIIAVYIGLPLLIFRIQLPNSIYNTLKTVGSMTTPISMIIVGCVLSKVKLRDALKDWTIYYSALLKLIIMPISIFIFGKIIKDDSVVMKTMVILQAMPAATMTSIFAENFNKQKEYAAIIVLITTLLSLITFPIILKIIV